MRKYMFLFFIYFVLLSIPVNAGVFSIQMTIYRDDRVDVMNVEIIDGKETSFPAYPDANYLIKIVSFKRAILYQAPMKIDFIVHPFPEGEIIINETEKDIRLPYFPDAEKIELYRDNILINTINVVDYLCNNNGVCDANENADNCPNDCRQTTTTVPQQGGNNVVMLIAGIVLLVIGIVTLYFLVRRRNASKEAGILRKLK